MYQAGYYTGIYELICQYKLYSVLGHLDLIKRYDRRGDYPDEKILPLAEKIMKQAIADEKGIEVNTSTRRYGMPGTSPSRRLLELYHDLGGRIITIGSDAHDPAHIAADFHRAEEVLRECGFRYYTIFEKRQPEFKRF